jgi:DNA-binding NtrC family response regulator
VGKTIEEVEREMIIGTLEATGGRRKETAQMLGITTRTLSNKLKTYRIMGIPVPRKRSASS